MIGVRAFGEELVVVAVEMAQQANQQFEARMRFAGFDAQRRGDVGNFRGHFGLVDVHTDSDDCVMHAVGLGAHLCEDAGEFSSAHEKIVGPANVGCGVQVFGGGISRCEARDQRQ